MVRIGGGNGHTLIRLLVGATMQEKQNGSDAVLTEQGLKLKGVEKIHRIHCDASYQDVVLQTWQFGRIVRRDFNLLSYKVFFAVRRDDQRRKIRHLVDNLVEEAEVLEALVRRYELAKTSDQTILNLRIVSDESLRLLKTLQAADKALSKLKNSEIAEVAVENCTPFFVAYHRLKYTLLEAGPNVSK